MILGESIFLVSGELLLAAGFHLTARYRERLKQLGFHSVYIQVEGIEDAIPETIISAHVQRELAASVQKNKVELAKRFDVRQEGARNIRKTIRQNKQYLNRFLSSSGLMTAIEKMIDEVLNQPSLVLNMSALQKAGGELFAHAIDVTVTALAIGRKYRYSYEEMKQLAIGAINYDLGLIALPQQLLEKSGSFVGEELAIYQQHTVYGYLMLSQNPSIVPTSAAVALQHHEHQDGTGFPRGLKGENLAPLKDFSRKKMIHRFSEIVAVADTYDRLLTGRLGEDACSIREAIRKLIEMSGHRLNSDIVRCLATMVPVYPVGARFRVVNAPSAQLVGYYGAVVKTNSEDMEKPRVVLYETRNHQKIKPILVDLATHSGFGLEIVA